MARRIKRMRDFEISLTIPDDGFIAPPRTAQRNWLLNRALNEFAADLTRLDEVARRFATGVDAVPTAERTHAVLDDQDIMEDWQLPIMRAMAAVAAETHGDVLEIGFGRGISAGYIQDLAVRSHTIVECNDSVVERFVRWKEGYANRDIRVIHGRWQDALDRLEMYDSVFFHTYPLSESEYVDNIVNSTTFAAHFFETAAAHLRDGGVFTYMTNEVDSFSREHQRLLFRHFQTVQLSVLRGIDLPDDLQDAWWADSMVIVKATK